MKIHILLELNKLKMVLFLFFVRDEQRWNFLFLFRNCSALLVVWNIHVDLASSFAFFTFSAIDVILKLLHLFFLLGDSLRGGRRPPKLIL